MFNPKPKEDVGTGLIGNHGDVPSVAADATVITPAEPPALLQVKQTEEVINERPEFLQLKKEGNDLFQEQLYLEAIAKYEKAKSHAKNDDDIAALLHNIGFSYEKMNDLEKAAEAYSKATEMKDKYIKVLKRRAKVLCNLQRHQEALDDMVDVVVADIKEQQQRSSETDGPKPIDFQTATSQLLVEILLSKTEVETRNVLERRATKPPPTTTVESFLRSFSGDPVSRIWKGIEPSAVDQLIANGSADDLKGYLAALRDLKLKKYENIVKYCTEEIENPEATEENVLNALFLRGTMTFIWTMSLQTVEDFTKVTQSPLASNKMKSSAFLKLGMRHTNTRHPFSKPDKIDTISEEYGQAEGLWIENPDVYFHGSMLLVDRAAPIQAMEMLEMGVSLCAPEDSVMLRTFYWTLKLTMSPDVEDRNAAYIELRNMESEFDTPECHEMFAQAIMTAGGLQREVEYNVQFDHAIKFCPEDPVFKIKKMIFRHWLGEHGQLVKEDEAIAEIYSLIEKEGPNNLAYYHVGQMEIIRGNVEIGLEAINKSIELSGYVHEIEARVAAKLEIVFHMRVNERLKEEGLDDLAEQVRNLTMRAYP